MSSLVSFDQSLFLLINTKWTAAWLDAVMVAVTEIGHAQWIFGILWIIWMIRTGKKGRQAGVAILVAVLIGDYVISHFLKPFFARARPWAVLPEARTLTDLAKVSLYSFPSNHAANSGAVAVFGILYFRNLWIRVLLVDLALMVGYSRIYVGVHYPADVLGGFLVGTFFALAAYLLVRRAA